MARTFLVAVVAQACAGSHVIDVAGNAVQNGFVEASGSDLRVVADSGSGARQGWRAVIELVVNASAYPQEEWQRAPALRLWGADGVALRPTAIAPNQVVHFGSSRCCERERHRCTAVAQRYPEGERRAELEARSCQETALVIRAEFPLRNRPRPGDSVFVSDGLNVRGARWRPVHRP